MKMLNTATLQALAAKDKLCSINVRNLDPEATHIMWLTVPFHNDRPEHRSQVMYKVAGYDQPFKAVMDILADDYERLDNVPKEIEDRYPL